MMIKVLLVPSPSPPILLPLAASLLKAGYIVIVAVPQVKEAEALERRLSGLNEKSALRVLIYDPEDVSDQVRQNKSELLADMPEQHIPTVPTITPRYSYFTLPIA